VTRWTNLENFNKGRVMSLPKSDVLCDFAPPSKDDWRGYRRGGVQWRGKAETKLLTLWRPPTPVPMSSVLSKWGPWIL
jgi:hypothetical protein